MTDHLPAYSGDEARCPKCGCDSACTRWQPAGTRFVSPHGPGALVGLGDGPEWMLRECNNCDYSWPEALPSAIGANTSGRVLAADGRGRPDGIYSVGDRVDQPPAPPRGTVVEFWFDNRRGDEDPGPEPLFGWGMPMVCGARDWWYPLGREDDERAGRTWSDLLGLRPGPARIVSLPQHAAAAR